MPEHKIDNELIIKDVRFGKDNTLNTIIFSSRHYDVYVYPNEIPLFIEKLLEIPEIRTALNANQNPMR